MNSTDQKTISDFGSQWTTFTANEGYYGSVSLLQDIFGPLLDVRQVAGKKVLDIGSGTGRIVNMLLSADAESVVAVEPSDAFYVLQENLKEYGDRVLPVKNTGDAIDFHNEFELAVSIGVLHHITEPAPVLKRMVEALIPGGRCLIWLYGKEGNELYLCIFGLLRLVTTRLPDKALFALAELMVLAVDLYIFFCRFISFLPMRSYMLEHLGKLTRENRKLTIIDQLNPAYAKYYSKQEAFGLMSSLGLVNVRLYHRHGYSWTVIGEKPVN